MTLFLSLCPASHIPFTLLYFFLRLILSEVVCIYFCFVLIIITLLRMEMSSGQELCFIFYGRSSSWNYALPMVGTHCVVYLLSE